ncbi:hypothetical protein L2E82_22582 [Cichorium intybus]|uniref:Uncharacterized protein n=1 Tax=Cichorium intybus TaxID=13427 RepID=A0ACB9DXM6_CICIN|nr:hypothetical protein L2E82_22582 [Cichorium intybus]
MPRIVWKHECIDKTFIEACIHEMITNGREGCSLKAVSWKNVGERLKMEHNWIVDQKQMKNRYDYLRSKFGAWLKLKNKTGNVYDPVTNRFTLTEEEWHLEIKSNKNVESLRTAPLPFPDLLSQLFEGAMSTGVDSWGPTSTLPHPSENLPDLNLTEDNDVYIPQFEQPPSPTNPHPMSEESSARTNTRATKRKSKETLNSKLMEVRDELTKDPRYNTAILLFGESKDFRKLWLHLDPECCENWVRNAGRKYGNMDSCKQILVFMIIAWYWLKLASRKIGRIRDNTSALTGHAYTQELLNGSTTQCQELMRLSREAFVLLCNHFKQRNWLQSGRAISVEENMAMFLTILGHNERFRMVKRRFQHSTETVHRCFHEVRRAMMHFAREMIVPTFSNASSNTSERHRRLKQIFSGAIGALDGTLIHAVIPVDQQARYRGRGKEAALNPTSGFPFPPTDKYYLCDAAYTNTRGFMTPYHNTRYWLADFLRQRALSKEEKFNHAHAQLRNVIERAYGVLKKRFPILKQMAPYPFSVQRDIVIACFAVHNFIRKYKIDDQLFAEMDLNTTVVAEDQGGENDDRNIHDMEWGSQGSEYMNNLRNQIANQL